jgi:hypothetical protein
LWSTFPEPFIPTPVSSIKKEIIILTAGGLYYTLFFFFNFVDVSLDFNEYGLVQPDNVHTPVSFTVQCQFDVTNNILIFFTRDLLLGIA